jgi:hypothetical protein
MIRRFFRALGCPYAEIWLPAYLRREMGRLAGPRASGARHLLFCFVDHYEPHVGRADDATARRRLDAWLEQYPRIADRHGDAHGRPPGHSFFYPYDEMEPGELRDLAALCAAGYGELEIHLHHRDDTSDTLRGKLRAAVEHWQEAGALGSWPETGRPAFGFIHGNWALDNSRVEGERNFCGVNDEIRVLAEAGCYADFTFPALKQMAQPRLCNCVYYATDDPRRPKSHDWGQPVRVGGKQSGDLMIVQGPLGILRRPGLVLPRPEDGDITGQHPATPERVDAWVRTAIHLPGRPEWVFVKVHTHGAADDNLAGLLGGGFDALFADLEARYNDGRRWRLHYVNARELYNIIKAAEAGRAGDPSDYRDFLIAPPPGPGRTPPSGLLIREPSGVGAGR